ncbi:MAG: MBL fold hydrolase [Myxococcales bacterium]|nr:MBL fold hydrolase [Myxococcales bacterium]|tara:strand:- start:47 stop:1363 length:1317 start_codon:yes stop_codon:yes gene_type:complete
MKLDPNKLHFIPLGGCGEIGMNLNVYVYQRSAVIVDCGVMFSAEKDAAVFADIDSLWTVADRVLAILITHAHQDHIGALKDVWPELKCPIYGSRFAIEMVYSALDETDFSRDVPIRVLGQSEAFKLGPFEIERIPLTHSTVEMGAFVIAAAGSTVLHTGDWTFDSDPIVGPLSDLKALEKLGCQNLNAVVGDSTNALESGWTASEGSLRATLLDEIQKSAGRVCVTIFSSNVARIKLLADLAQETGRTFVVLGRSIETVVRAAQSAGYLTDLPPLVSPKQYGYLPPGQVLVVCTGSQGSSNSMLGRLAKDNRNDVYLESGDTVLFSARRVPGCEDDIDTVQALLKSRGIEVVDAQTASIHVSGHPKQDELRMMYSLVKPGCVIPVHGMAKHLDAHANLVKDMGLLAERIENGDVVEIGATCIRIGRVPSGRRLRPLRF